MVLQFVGSTHRRGTILALACSDTYPASTPTPHTFIYLHLAFSTTVHTNTHTYIHPLTHSAHLAIRYMLHNGNRPSNLGNPTKHWNWQVKRGEQVTFHWEMLEGILGRRGPLSHITVIIDATRWKGWQRSRGTWSYKKTFVITSQSRSEYLH